MLDRISKKIITKVITLLSKMVRSFNQNFAWKHFAQRGEFSFHKQNDWRASGQFEVDNETLLEYFGFSRDQFANCVIADVGAGSKLRSKFFRDAHLIVIEPLADRFIREIDWCDLKDADEVYSSAAEQRIVELKNKCDFVMSINVLDHCFEFNEIIYNIAFYLKKGGIAFLSFDSHQKTDHMHPLVLTDDICRPTFLDAGFSIKKSMTGIGPFGATYGHGDTLSYWLQLS